MGRKRPIFSEKLAAERQSFSFGNRTAAKVSELTDHVRVATRLPLPWALFASVAAHALLVAIWSTRSSAKPVQPASTLSADSWAASSVEVGVASDTREGSEARAQTEPVTKEVPSSPPPPEQAAEPDAARDEASASTPLPPRVKPRSKNEPPKPRSSAASVQPARRAPSPASSATLAGASAEPGQASSTGSLGTLGLPPGVRHLAKAFARALPEGGHRDPAWSELPLGPVGRAVLTIHIDADGHLEKALLEPEHSTPAPLKRMIEHTILLLKAGTFSLDKKSVKAGIERLSIDVTLTQDLSEPDETGAPLLMAKEGHQAPEPERPGYARFTLNSGRHMEAVLKLLGP